MFFFVSYASPFLRYGLLFPDGRTAHYQSGDTLSVSGVYALRGSRHCSLLEDSLPGDALWLGIGGHAAIHLR
ncbi:unnamed protein product [Ranitomeya imitator]|uniref:Uncharacterized protein n=1 Tax=Ranitomeya imitator TaxID=111125 RepID=A0ABN9LLE7_9NEOB|nr:unnamed protein product [Ranitomeya imitator]